MNGKAALAAIKEFGISRFCYWDGCFCASFSLQGINVDIGCRKTDRGMGSFWGTKIHVWSRSDEVDGGHLAEIGREIARQMRERDRCPIKVRFCDPDHDYKGTCTYCGNPRGSDGYLCSDCLAKEGGGTYVGQSVADQYDFRKHDFTMIEDQEYSW